MSLLLSILSALFFLLVTARHMAGPGAEFDSDSGHTASLIPQFMIVGDSIVRKAFTVTTASPRNKSPLFTFGWLSYSLEPLFWSRPLEQLIRTVACIARPGV